MYRMIGGDGQEYGPISEAQLSDWIRQGRANEGTRIRREGEEEWRPMSAFPEFAAALKGGVADGGASAGTGPGAGGVDPWERSGEVRVGECWRGALSVCMRGPLLGASAVFLLVNVVLGVLSLVPVLGLLVSLAMLALSGPLFGGMTMVFLREIRGEGGRVEDMFQVAKEKFLPTMLVYVVTMLVVFGVTFVLMFGGGLIAGLLGMGLGMSGSDPVAIGILVAVIGLVLMVPVLVLAMHLIFAIPLVVDRDMEVFDSIRLSYRMVSRQRGAIFAIMLLSAALYGVGVLLCGVGIFLTLPLAQALLMYAYDSCLGREHAPR